MSTEIRKSPDSPWERAIAHLGRAGWELIVVQHANSAGDMGGGGMIDHSNAVAYFKRRIEDGRAIDDQDITKLAEGEV